MAKNKSADSNVRILTEILLTQERTDRIARYVKTEQPVAEKIGGVAANLLEQLADGGMMLAPETIKAIEDSTGETVEEDAQLIAMVEAGSDRSGGKLVGRWEVDPAYEAIVREMAEFQGIPEVEFVQRCMDEAVDQGWVLGEIQPPPRRVLMPDDAYERLKKLLGGKDFSNGTELAELIEETVSNAAGLFAE